MKKTNEPFSDSHGHAVLKMSYCVFMDVLGFKQMIQESIINKTESSLFSSFHRVIRAEISRLKQYMDPDDRLWSIKVFTDNVVLGFPLFSGDGESEFGFIVDRIAEYQLSMALAGFFVRGGLSIGQLFMDDNTVYGPAVLDAYKAETELARDPRIVLSREVSDVVKRHTMYYADAGDSPQNTEIIIDPDGYMFINYLEKVVIEDKSGQSIAWNMLKLHKKRIEFNLTKFRSKPIIWSKYYWLANYHDYFYQTHHNFPGYKKQFLIDPKLAKPEFATLVQSA